MRAVYLWLGGRRNLPIAVSARPHGGMTRKHWCLALGPAPACADTHTTRGVCARAERAPRLVSSRKTRRSRAGGWDGEATARLAPHAAAPGGTEDALASSPHARSGTPAP